MTKIKGYIVIAFLIVCVMYIVSIHTIKNQYDEELIKLRQQNEKLKLENKKHIGTIEDLLNKVKCECEDCEWLQKFYDEFHEKVGAFE